MTAGPDGVDYDVRDGAAWLRLARPERGNALDVPMASALLAGVRRAIADDARVVVLAAQGEAFCVGGDLAAMQAAEDAGRYVEQLASTLHDAVAALMRMDAVVVSVVQGVAAGGGFPLAAAADLVLAARSARFVLAYSKVGLSPDGGSTLLPATLGLHRTLHLALLNPAWTAEEAQTAGLVAQVHPDPDLPGAAEAVVAQLLAGSRSAQVAAKRLLRDRSHPDPEHAMAVETAAISAAVASADGQEGLRAFFAKSRPTFPSSS